ncbi:glycosyltransferase [Adlercreutzia sp. ZJ141]|uniref:glycosyltransferase n=1 Tax=Adlercreutzia sp. ZJ141 TaxID=2709406 RepID=UPI0013ED0134|nr:glycosyltransferase [Adlercreutzia sp. ZJ141]
MRILFLTHSLSNGGAERVSANIANELHRRGEIVSVVSLQDRSADYSLDAGINHECIDTSGSFTARAISKLISVNSIVGDFRPNVIVSLGAGYQYILFSRLFNKFSLITSLRNDPSFLFEGHLGRLFVYKAAFSASDAVVFQTQEAKQYFSRRVQSKSFIIRNPLMDNLPQNLNPLFLRDKEFVSFGRLEPQKNIMMLLEAFSLFCIEDSEYNLTIYGRGSQKEALEAKAKSLGLGERVHFLDFSKSVHSKILNAVAFVSSSNFEGLSNSMIEAMAIGLPVICTDCPCGGARDVVGEYKNGLLAEVGNPADLCNKMQQLIYSGTEYESYLSKIDDLRRDLSSSAIVEQWLKLIDEVAHD